MSPPHSDLNMFKNGLGNALTWSKFKIFFAEAPRRLSGSILRLKPCDLYLKASIHFFKSVNQNFRNFKRQKLQHNRLHCVFVLAFF